MNSSIITNLQIITPHSESTTDLPLVLLPSHTYRTGTMTGSAATSTCDFYLQENNFDGIRCPGPTKPKLKNSANRAQTLLITSLARRFNPSSSLRNLPHALPRNTVWTIVPSLFMWRSTLPCSAPSPLLSVGKHKRRHNQQVGNHVILPSSRLSPCNSIASAKPYAPTLPYGPLQDGV